MLSRGNRLIRRLGLGVVVAGAVVTALAPSIAGAVAIEPDDACPPDSVPDAGFEDEGSVAEGTVFAAECMAAYEIVQGTDVDNDGTPEMSATNPVVRAQMASFLMRKLDLVDGFTRPTNAPDAFTDDNGNTHEQNINDAAAVDLAEGTGPGQFSPNQGTDRAQMATFIKRQLEIAGVDLPEDPPDAFTDDEGLPAEQELAINQPR